jgi:hypothetical protein
MNIPLTLDVPSCRWLESDVRNLLQIGAAGGLEEPPDDPRAASRF